MTDNKMTFEVMEYIVWVVEIAANEFFNGDKTTAYNALKSSKLWNLYVEHYDVTHTLGVDYILDEMREFFWKNGVPTSC